MCIVVTRMQKFVNVLKVDGDVCVECSHASLFSLDKISLILALPEKCNVNFHAQIIMDD